MTDQQADGIDAEPAEVDEEPVDRGARRTLVRALALLAVVCFAGAVAMAVIAAQLSRDLDAERDQRQAATRAAARFADVFLAYDHERLDRTKQAVLRLSTGKFRREYEEGINALNELLLTTKSRATAVVKDVYTGDIESGSVAVVVVADQAVEGISGTRRRLDAWLRLDLVETGSRWLVDGVTSLNFGQTPEGGGSAPADPQGVG